MSPPNQSGLTDPRPFGVNVIGYLESEKGRGESVRSSIRVLEAAGIPIAINHLVDTGSTNTQRCTWTEEHPYGVNLIHVNPEELPLMVPQIGTAYLEGRYTIGCWSWELADFPPRWRSSFDYFDEIWVPSEFARVAVAGRSPIPVVTVPHAIAGDAAVAQGTAPRIAGPPDGRFRFLFMFDFMSTWQRKNPFGVVEAFRRAFPQREDVALIIKTMHKGFSPGVFAQLQEACRDERVTVIDGVWSRAELTQLIADCDCVVSLHRAEGFGLVLAEAMALGKPVIATGYSGNMEYMRADNSLLVDYQLIELTEDVGPYPRGSRWAEPALEDAVERMRWVVAHPREAREIGARAAQAIDGSFSPSTIGASVRDRLHRIHYARHLSHVPLRVLERLFGELTQPQQRELDMVLRDYVTRNSQLQRQRDEAHRASQAREAADQHQLAARGAELEEQRQRLAAHAAELTAREAQLSAARRQREELLRDLTAARERLTRMEVDRQTLAKAINRIHQSRTYRYLARPLWTLSGTLKRFGRRSASGRPRPVAETGVRHASGTSQDGRVRSGTSAGCTIISKNYLAYARVLSQSFLQHHPDARFFVLLVDEIDDHFDPAGEPFELVRLDALGIPDLPRVCFQYNVVELHTAVKPSFLSHLFERYGIEKVLFLDPDILVLRPLSPLLELLDRSTMVLTPHLTSPLDEDEHHASELTILSVGTFNLGFIALREGAATRAFLRWWQDRLYTKCELAPERGVHVDQKWLDFAPSFVEDVCVLRDPGYNVAYWNLPQRPVTIRGDEVSVAGNPCYFFHFSGLDPEHIETVSKHQDRLTLDQLGQARAVFERYRDLLAAAGYHETKRWPYRFGCFDHGVRIPETARKLYLGLGDAVQRFGNPFRTDRSPSVFQWLNGPVDGEEGHPGQGGITRLWQAMYDQRPDLARRFPDVRGANREAFLRWVVDRGRFECRIDDSLVPSRPARSDPTGRFRHAATRVYSRLMQSAGPVLRPVVTWREGLRSGRGDRARAARVGVNVAGYLKSEKGVGEVVRGVIRSLQAVRMPYGLDEVRDPRSSNAQRHPLSPTPAGRPLRPALRPHLDGGGFAGRHRVNLVCVNADQVPVFAESRGTPYFQNHENIGYWTWELSDFPERWRASFDYFDEIWVPSRFVHNAIAHESRIPVVVIPYSVVPPGPTAKRTGGAQSGRAGGRFQFLFMFDFMSYWQRKNPFGILEAFTRAFGGDDSVELVIKTAHAESAPQAFQALQEAARGTRTVRVVDGIWRRQDVDRMLADCDSFVSLHRSEGFGLALAETMALGKPVIATGYSGNLEFMTPQNSLLVEYRLVELPEDVGPYRRGSRWAEPNLDHAATHMRWVASHHEEARAMGERAAATIRDRLSPAAVGTQIRARISSMTGRRTSAGIGVVGGEPRMQPRVAGDAVLATLPHK